MSLSKLALGYRDFCSEARIRESIRESKHFNSGNESPPRSSCLLIFRTASQQTWLVTTPVRLYVVLDDIRKEGPKVIRSIPSNSLFHEDGSPKMGIKVHSRLHGYSEGIGGLEFENYRNLLFSHKLFRDATVEERVTELLKERMTPATVGAG